MARGFLPAGKSFVAELDEPEARLLSGLAKDVAHLLRERQLDHPAPSPAVAKADAPTKDDLSWGGPAQADQWWAGLGLDDLAGLGAEGSLPHEAGSGSAAPAPLAPPQDPAVARLLPDVVAASDAEPGEAARLRGLTEPGLVASKLAGLEEAAALLVQDPLRVESAAAPRFAAALNDIRLVLAQRLGIESEADARRVDRLAERADDPVDQHLALLYSFVSWLQESLMEAMLRRNR